MLKKTEFTLLFILSTAMAVIVFVQIGLNRSNQSFQKKLIEQQSFIQQSMQLEGLYVEMIKAVAELSERTQDKDLRQILTNQGMSVQKALQPADQDTSAISGDTASPKNPETERTNK